MWPSELGQVGQLRTHTNSQWQWHRQCSVVHGTNKEQLEPRGLRGLRGLLQLCSLVQENPAVARQMCYKALGSMMIHKAEILFVQGVEQVNQMYLFTDGKLSYFRDSSVGIHTKASSQRTNIVRKKDKITIGQW
ncbi:unnamed protein product [Durusdinium trenchii]|uniref:Uncharacterized protein n=1 Tax=Durusdinium trenchii TaxID=1381693 RepID=A0ABP0KKF6_9DINO